MQHNYSTRQRLYLYVISQFNEANFRSNIVNIICDGIASLQSQLKDPRSLAVLPAIKARECGEISDFKFYDVCISSCKAASKLANTNDYFAALAVSYAAISATKIMDRIGLAVYMSEFIDTIAEGSAILEKHLCT